MSGRAIINQEIEGALKRHFDGPFRFLLAVSGGSDSQVLIKAFSHVAKAQGHRVWAMGINHGLRPEADSELDLAESLCRKESIPFIRERISVEPGSNLQARAREGRYYALWNKAHEIGANLVTAHHRDDRAETVLIRMMRATSAGSLAVLPEIQYVPVQDVHLALFRPLLKVSKQDILGYAKRWGLTYADDPSNSNEEFLRVWVRNTLLPLMQEKSPDIVNKLNQISDDLMKCQTR